ncbi:hypothetical protein [Pectobacterium wasabiae]|uniref:Uncharacterized protein n=1 Tax=Pectobacterium wasabiae TaxID=55208 RepID=A0AAW3EB99_9GAMM|nr:hypothetical protein [Pectobacterium wasabiae]AOR65408.1 hypothetical protein A7983_19505 [Pectobacterium wasabiae CFBP 3304]EJS93159.1 Hypothetical protein Y17_3657 [Pectobacterium wasabiae CFBP 3304]KFX01449.1 hypothetical protein JV38_22265 [Pectobacterium wasabiae]KGA26334.1 hypothetical protein KU73_21925 [Pectobacterium wasabiae]
MILQSLFSEKRPKLTTIYTAQFLDANVHPESTILRIDINPFPRGAKKRQSVLICKNDEPVVVLCIYVEVDDNGYLLEQCFRELLLNENKIALLYGQHVHLFDTVSYEVKSLYLHDYVGHLYPIPDIDSGVLSDTFLVTTFLYTFLIHVDSGIIWQSKQCAIDGVIIDEVQGNVIYGSGGWEPFRLSLNTGHVINSIVNK